MATFKRHFKKIFGSKQGLTLLEVLLSVILLVVASLGTLSLTSVTKSSSNKNSERQIALRAMEGKLAEYRTKSNAENKALAVGPQPDVDVNQLRKWNGSTFEAAKIKTLVERLEGDDGLKWIAMKLEWTNFRKQDEVEFLTGVVYAE